MEGGDTSEDQQMDGIPFRQPRYDQHGAHHGNVQQQQQQLSGGYGVWQQSPTYPDGYYRTYQYGTANTIFPGGFPMTPSNSQGSNGNVNVNVNVDVSPGYWAGVPTVEPSSGVGAGTGSGSGSGSVPAATVFGYYTPTQPVYYGSPPPPPRYYPAQPIYVRYPTIQPPIHVPLAILPLPSADPTTTTTTSDTDEHTQWEIQFRRDSRPDLDTDTRSSSTSSSSSSSRSRSHGQTSTSLHSDTPTEAGDQWRSLSIAGLLYGVDFWNKEKVVRDNATMLELWLRVIATPPNEQVVEHSFGGQLIAEATIWNVLPSSEIDYHSRCTSARSIEALGEKRGSEGSWSDVVSTCLHTIIDHIHHFRYDTGHLLRLQPQHKLDSKITSLLSLPSLPNYIPDYSVGYEPLQLVGGSRTMLVKLRKLVDNSFKALGFDTMRDSALLPFLIIEVKTANGDLSKGKRQIFASMIAVLKVAYDLERDPALKHHIQSIPPPPTKFREDVVYGLIPRGDHWHFFGMTLAVGAAGVISFIPHQFLTLNLATFGAIKYAHHVIHRILCMGRKQAARYIPLVQAIVNLTVQTVETPTPASSPHDTGGNPADTADTRSPADTTPRPSSALLSHQRNHALRSFHQSPRGRQSMIATAEWAKDVASSVTGVGQQSTSHVPQHTHQDVSIWACTSSTLVGTSPTDGDDVQIAKNASASNPRNLHLLTRSRSWSSPSRNDKNKHRQRSTSVHLHLPSAGNVDVSWISPLCLRP